MASVLDALKINPGKMRKYLVFMLLVSLVLSSKAQRVSNVTVAQEGLKLRIQYELSTASPTEVGLYISENNGGTWSKVTLHLTGDVGPSVSAGSKQMVWDVLQARENLVGNAIVFKVKVGSEIKSVKIGNQVWMAENLNVDHYRNGDPIPTGLSNSQWESTTKGAYAIYNDDPANEKIYGKLYNWYAVNDARGLCPAGWHVPSDNEWTVLSENLGGEEVSGGKLKSTTLWYSDVDATNSSGFNALPGGMRLASGSYDYIGPDNWFWCFTESNSNEAWSRGLGRGFSDMVRSIWRKRTGFSVRCVKD
jgi:uncharacterized protein (TIGR02145 family)